MTDLELPASAATAPDPDPNRRAGAPGLPVRDGLVARDWPEGAAGTWEQERFVGRVRALFYARLMFLGVGLLVLAVPEWSAQFGLTAPWAYVGYAAMLLWSVANFVVIDHPTAGRAVTYVTLCLDLLVTVYLIVMPQPAGGLHSPLLATQLVFTLLFAILFPRPLAILPPLLALPITTRLDLLLERRFSGTELLTLLWYLALNLVIVYVMVYLNEREAAAHRQVVRLQDDLQALAVVEERNRLAREIHDGVGASLSSLILQSEYLLRLAKDDALRRELEELRSSAEESIDELRRSLRMMRDDFELAQALEDHVRTFRERTRLAVRFERRGEPGRLSPEVQLTLFRVLQEALANAAKHSGARGVEVRLAFAPAAVLLTVEDDGQGFDPANTPPGHYGLRHLHERARQVGGQLAVDAAPGRGVKVTLSIPAAE